MATMSSAVLEAVKAQPQSTVHHLSTDSACNTVKSHGFTNNYPRACRPGARVGKCMHSHCTVARRTQGPQAPPCNSRCLSVLNLTLQGVSISAFCTFTLTTLNTAHGKPEPVFVLSERFAQNYAINKKPDLPVEGWWCENIDIASSQLSTRLHRRLSCCPAESCCHLRACQTGPRHHRQLRP